MQVKAKAKFIKMSPSKIRLAANLVKKMPVEKALSQLKFMNKLASVPVSKLIQSAIANAEHNFALDKNNLFVKELTVNEGPTLKRSMPRAHGRASAIRKRTSHINLILGEIKDSGTVKTQKRNIEAPVRLGEQPRQDSEVKMKKRAGEEAVGFAEDKEKGKVIVDPRMQAKAGHAKIEGKKGFTTKMFSRKSG